jgi:DNA-binding NarL/FixJ family response regulator
MILRNSHTTTPGSNGGSVLIVDDNIQLATCLEMLLEAHSFEVCRTTNVSGALKHIQLADFDVILCDFVMPGQNGDVLYEAVGREKPHLRDRFIFMSGRSDDPKWIEFVVATGRPIFWKPFAVGDLLNAIQSVARSSHEARPGFGRSTRQSLTAAC